MSSRLRWHERGGARTHRHRAAKEWVALPWEPLAGPERSALWRPAHQRPGLHTSRDPCEGGAAALQEVGRGEGRTEGEETAVEAGVGGHMQGGM